MNELKIIEHKNQRVLLTSQLAEIYETTENNIIQNFNRNKERFIEERDYILLKGDELKEFLHMTNCHVQISSMVRTLYLWTERGANRHSKILDTDQAWKQFDVLEETYFRVKENNYNLPTTYIEALERLIETEKEKEQYRLENQVLKPKGEYFDCLVERNLLTNFRDTAKEFGMKQKDFIISLRERKFIYRDQKGNLKPYAKYVDDGLFELKEYKSRYNNHVSVQTLITPKGRETFRLLLNVKNKLIA